MHSGRERLASIFGAARDDGRGALMPFIVGGYPSPGSIGALISSIDAAGADVIEVGFPFSDPIADGPVVAAAMHDALGAGATPDGVIRSVADIRSSVDAGLVAMVSVSIAARLGGPSGFVNSCVEAGFDGFIFPDASLEEAQPYVEACDAADAGCSLLISPSTSAERAGRIAAASSGFVYMLARSGVTGERESAPDVSGRVAELRTSTDLPIAVGFGISSADHVRAVVEHADAAIVGSALVRRLREAEGDPAEAAGRFVAELAAGLNPDRAGRN
ncbi:MAG: tryptophan synthase subunit alpha [Planctomycetota bacterium]